MINVKDLLNEHLETGKEQFVVTLEDSQEWFDIQKEGYEIQQEGNHNVSYGYNTFVFPGEYYITITKQEPYNG